MLPPPSRQSQEGQALSQANNEQSKHTPRVALCETRAETEFTFLCWEPSLFSYIQTCRTLFYCYASSQGYLNIKYQKTPNSLPDKSKSTPTCGRLIYRKVVDSSKPGLNANNTQFAQMHNSNHVSRQACPVAWTPIPFFQTKSDSPESREDPGNGNSPCKKVSTSNIPSRGRGCLH